MSDDSTTETTTTTGASAADSSGAAAPAARPRRRRAAGRDTGPPPEVLADPFAEPAPTVPAVPSVPAEDDATDAVEDPDAEPAEDALAAADAESDTMTDPEADAGTGSASPFAVGFLAPEVTPPSRRRRGASRPAGAAADDDEQPRADADAAPAATSGTAGRGRGAGRSRPRDADADADADVDADLDGGADDTGTQDDSQAGPEADADGDDGEGAGGARRRRRRGGRGRGRSSSAAGSEGEEPSGQAGPAEAQGAEDDDEGDDGPRSSSRRRRRRRRSTGEDGGSDDPPGTVTHVRDGVRGVSGSTRLEAKRQRRRDGRSDSRRRVVVTEAEFLARREAVTRTMVVRKTGARTQVAILEDGVLSEHYVTKSEATSYAGGIFLGRVQNVLPSMEAAFVDIGKGRNAVLYAGEVSYDASMTEGGRPPRIEQALSSGQQILVQVTKDPVGHKGARLTGQISLPGRFLVYVPNGPMAGISRKLPEAERTRLKAILKRVVPDDAGVIVRTAAEGASEEELVADVERLQSLWSDIQAKAGKGNAPALLHGEADLVVRAVRDVFNEDISELVVADPEVAREIEDYVAGVAPDLLPRIRRWTEQRDVFSAHRIDEQLTKALSRKVNLPSGGSLVIDHTEALTAIDVNTGKFTGSGGSLEETVTRNNLEAAEEIARQLRLRDVGGMVIIDFIDMVLEANRDLVLRRLVECLARDRTKHQVSEVTSLGLVQLTRKRVGQGLLESFSETCSHCNGRGLIVSLDGHAGGASPTGVTSRGAAPSPAAVAAKVMAAAAASHHDEPADGPADDPAGTKVEADAEAAAPEQAEAAEAPDHAAV